MWGKLQNKEARDEARAERTTCNRLAVAALSVDELRFLSWGGLDWFGCQIFVLQRFARSNVALQWLFVRVLHCHGLLVRELHCNGLFDIALHCIALHSFPTTLVIFPTLLRGEGA